MSKNPSSRPRGLGRFRVSDDYRVPFPGHEPMSIRDARYFLTPLGRVYRDDGFLLRPKAGNLHIQLNGGRVDRSLPAAVYAAFGRKKPKIGRVRGDEAEDLDVQVWVPWVSPLAPIDEKTGRRSCATRHVRLALMSDLHRLARKTITAKQVTTLKIR